MRVDVKKISEHLDKDPVTLNRIVAFGGPRDSVGIATEWVENYSIDWPQAMAWWKGGVFHPGAAELLRDRGVTPLEVTREQYRECLPLEFQHLDTTVPTIRS